MVNRNAIQNWPNSFHKIALSLKNNIRYVDCCSLLWELCVANSVKNKNKIRILVI